MSIAELKIDLINQIKNITDIDKLEEISQLIKFQIDDTIYETTEEDKKAIKEARNQIENKEVYTNKEMQKEIQKWLEK